MPNTSDVNRAMTSIDSVKLVLSTFAIDTIDRKDIDRSTHSIKLLVHC
jgi:hypothetical protein